MAKLEMNQKHPSVHKGSKGAIKTQNAALTPFPSLTGLRSSTLSRIPVSKTRLSEITLLDLQEAAMHHNASPTAILQGAWATILAVYIGTSDEVRFLTMSPTNRNTNAFSTAALRLCKYDQKSLGESSIACDLVKVHESVLDSTDQEEQIQSEGERMKVSSGVGTLLDLGRLFPDIEARTVVEERGEPDLLCNFDLQVGVTPSSNRALSLTVTASTKHLNSDAAQLMLTQFDHVLHTMVAYAKTPIREVCQQIPSSLLSISNPDPITLTAFISLQSQFERYARSDPHLVALELWGRIDSQPLKITRKWTYGELDVQAEIFASHLQNRLPCLEDSVVPICMDRCPATYIAILGILKAGAAWCPIDPSFPPLRRHNLIARANAKLLVVNSQSPRDGIPDDVTAINTDEIEWNIRQKRRAASIHQDSLAYLIWTSGTTGAPKGVPIHHQAAVASMRSLQKCIPVDVKNGNVRCLQFSHFTFDVFVQDLFYTWGVGGTLISADRATMLGSFAELATKAKATHAHLTPAFAASLPRKQCPTLEVVTMIGEKLTQCVADDWSENCRLYNTYGPAETAVVSTLRRVAQQGVVQSANVGHPLPSVSAFVLQDGENVMRHGIGELALGGPQLSKGYWQDPMRSSERFAWNERLQNRLYMSGDIVRQLCDGSFEFIGRTDDLVKIQGIRVELSEVAFAIRSCHTKVQHIEVLFLERPDRPSRVIVAFLAVPQFGASVMEAITDQRGVEVAQSAIKEAKTHLPDYMIPKVFVVVGAIPRTSSAKIDQAALKQLYAGVDLEAWEKKISTGQGDGASVGSYDIAVIDIIADLTGTLQIAMSRHSTLPSIGVDSIAATRLATRLQARDIEISIVDILQCSTLGDLLRRLSTAESSTRPPYLDISAFHHEYSKYLPSDLSSKVELILPTLPLQESLISESLKNAGSYWCNTFRILDPELDLRELERAYQRVAQSTDALRTSFLPVAQLSEPPQTNSSYIQLILTQAQVRFTIQHIDEKDLQFEARQQARKIAERHQEIRFAEPPWAIAIFVQESRSIMMLTTHHSIRDEPSLSHIMDDLQYTYRNNSSQQSRQRHQFREAISILYVGNDQSEKDEQFWAHILSNFEENEEAKSWPELRLTDDKSNNCFISNKCRLDKPYKDLRARAAGIDAMSFALLMKVVWGCILLEYLETDRVVFGETWSARSEASALTAVAGPLISVIPVPFHAQRTPREMLREQEAFQKRSKAHYGVHPRTIRKLMKKPEHHPLYPAIFNFIPDSEERSTNNTSCLWREMDDIVGLSVEHAIALNVWLSKDRTVELEITAGRQYMDKMHLEVLARQINALVDAFLDRPDDKLTDIINILPGDTLSIALPENGTSNNPAWTQNPTYWVDKTASLHSQWPAAEVVKSLEHDNFYSDTWSYEQLRTAYHNVAVVISDSKCTRQRIAVCVGRRLEIYAVILAILGTNNTYLPIAEDLPQERKLFLLQDSDAKMFFTTRTLGGSLSSLSQTCPTVFVEDIDYSKTVDYEPDPTSDPTDNAYLLYTSGSTGTPKGVVVSRGNLVSFIEAISDFIYSHVDITSLQGIGKWLGMASYAFDVHLLEMFFPWRHGMATVTAPRALLLDNLTLALQKLKITHASFVPSLVDNAGLDPANLPDLRYMSVGGEKITKKAIDTWSRSHVILANAYGPTEATIGCCFKKVEPETSVRNIGAPLPYTVAHVLRSGTTQYALRGTSGELCLTGDLVAKGYHRRPDAKGFVENFQGRRMYRTGDRVRLMADGSLEFLGRDDDQTKIRGQRIELGEVSEVTRSAVQKVRGVAYVEAAAIVAQHPSLARPQLVAFISFWDTMPKGADGDVTITSFDNPSVIADIRSYCSSTLPAFMVPDHFIRLTSIPLVTISRKVDSKRLRVLFSELCLADLTLHNKSAPLSRKEMSQAEKIVRDVATEALSIDQARIEIDSNLFGLGLDSLNVINLTIKLQKMGFSTTVSEIMKRPTIEQLALLPRNEREVGHPGPILRRTEDLKQRFCISSTNSDNSNIAAVRPCLPLQETLIASSLNHEGKGLYVNHVVLELSPEVDHERLYQAWMRTAEDHEILRTCFRDLDDHFMQIVLMSSPLLLERIETGRGPQRSDIASEIIATMESKPPVRLTLEVADSCQPRSVLLISMHHALYDVESFSMILDEVYARYQSDIPPRSDRTPFVSLIDYVQCQSRQNARNFWTEYLADCNPTLFPLPSGDVQSDSIIRELAIPLTTLEYFAASTSATPASLLQAMFGVALAETHRTSDVIFGIVLSGRTVPVENAHSILAPCVTTIPQRVQLHNSSKIRDNISAAQKGFVESIEYQHTALRDIHRWVEARKPLFDTLFSYTRKAQAASWSHLWWEAGSSMTNEFPLAIEITADATADRVVACLEFNEAFGTLLKAESFLGRLDEIIQALVRGQNFALAIPASKDTQTQLCAQPSVNHQWSKEERLMKDMIASIVNLAPKDITKEASFFALGIDSIIAIRFARSLKHHGFQCSSADVMRYPCIGELAQHLEKNRMRETNPNGSSDHVAASGDNKERVENEIMMTYPCTPLQSSMLTQTLGSDGSLYVHHYAIRLTEEVKPSRMKRAWEDLVARTEILRTCFQFSQRDRSWSGAVTKQSPTIWNEYNHNLSVQQVMRQVKKALTFRRESDFASPPWTVSVIRDVYVFSFHHSLYDGESLNLLFHDLANSLLDLPIPVRPAFSRAADIIRKCKVEAENYWLQILDGFQGIPVPPCSGHFREVKSKLNVNLNSVLEGCKRLGVTLQSLALLAYGKTLATFHGRQDVVFGHVIRGRTFEDADGVVGPLFNTVPMRVKLNEITTNWDAATSVQQLTGESQAHQHAALSNVQQAWQEELGDPNVELMDSLFVFQKRATGEDVYPWTAISVDDDTSRTEYVTNFELEQRESEIVVCVNSRRIQDLNSVLHNFELILYDIFQDPNKSATAILENLPMIEEVTSSNRDLSDVQEGADLGTSRGALASLRNVLAKVSGVLEGSIGDDASIFSLGLDSISAIQIVAEGRQKGLKLSVADVLQGRTLRGMCQRLRQRDRGVSVEEDQQTPLSIEGPSVSTRGSLASDTTRSRVLALAGIREDDVEDIIPCLAGQWFHFATWLESGRTLGEGTWTYRCKEIIDSDDLLGAWRNLRERHPILRTVFVNSDGTSIMQIVLKTAAVRSDAFQYVGLAAGSQDEVTQVVKQIAGRRFDLFSPPVELVLLQGKGRDYIVLKMHHTLYDAWTIKMLVQELTMLYHGRSATSVSRGSSTIQDIIHSSSKEGSRDYWRKSLEGCRPTILRSADPASKAVNPCFFFRKETMLGLHELESKCQQCDLSVPTTILVAFARSLATFASTSCPSFGLYQTGRASSTAGLDRLCFPCLNVTPLMAREVMSRDSKSVAKDIQSDLAARAPFEQCHMYDVLDWAGIGQKPLFNTYINILWGTDTKDRADDDLLLSPWTLGNPEDIALGNRAPGRTAVDGVNTSMLAEDNVFLDVQRDASKDSLSLVMRCDCGVFDKREAKNFLAQVIEETSKCVEHCAET